ncbi:hypothetical protein [Amycolatopsis methanolica]|nr:hypothetical protein [Amycolatopsis methanolica]
MTSTALPLHVTSNHTLRVKIIDACGMTLNCHGLGAASLRED